VKPGPSLPVLLAPTAAASSCPAGTDCVSYSVMLPAGGPYVEAYSANGAALPPSFPLVAYVLDGLAFVPSSGGTADCAPGEQKTQSYASTATDGKQVTDRTITYEP
jgi:hypothetical protein